MDDPEAGAQVAPQGLPTDPSMADEPTRKFEPSALKWRIEYIRGQRQQLWERRQTKLDSLRSKTQLMSKNALMAGTVPQDTKPSAKMRLDEFKLQQDEERKERKERDLRAEPQPVQSAGEDCEQYWSPERGLHRRRPGSSKKQENAELDWKDKYLMYPTIALSALAVSGLALLVLWHAAIHGWWWAVLLGGLRLGAAAAMSLLLVVLAVLLYEHITQSPGPSGVSSVSLVGYLMVMPVAYLYPKLVLLPLLAALMMSFCFKTLGIQPAPGTLLPVAILPLLVLGIVQAEPSVWRLLQLLHLEVQMSWSHL